MNRLPYTIVLLVLILSCKSELEKSSVFPKIKNVIDLEQTDFIPTLESTFSKKKNIIYGATIPFAWNEIKKKIGIPLNAFTCKELEKLNHNNSFLNVLKEEEYETFVEVNGNEIRAKAYFRKSLPFTEPLIKFEEILKFGKYHVKSFGFWGNCKYARINYFNNESDFSITLFPQDNEHEIILIMNQKFENQLSDFSEYYKIHNQQKNQKLHLNDADKVEIPIIEFNLEKTFDQFIGSKFRSETTEFEVTEAYQINAFILNEYGAKVKSEAEFAVEEAVELLENPQPKMMIFNKPFVVLLKRKDAENPYFGVYIANDELLRKNKNY